MWGGIEWRRIKLVQLLSFCLGFSQVLKNKSPLSSALTFSLWPYFMSDGSNSKEAAQIFHFLFQFNGYFGPGIYVLLYLFLYFVGSHCKTPISLLTHVLYSHALQTEFWFKNYKEKIKICWMDDRSIKLLILICINLMIMFILICRWESGKFMLNFDSLEYVIESNDVLTCGCWITSFILLFFQHDLLQFF